MKKKKKQNVLRASAAPIPGAPVMNVPEMNDSARLQEEAVCWMFTILETVLVYSVVAWIIQKVYVPDVTAMKLPGEKLLLASNSINPEPLEALLFRSAIVVFMFGLPVFYHLFSKKQFVKGLGAKPVFSVLAFLFVAAIPVMIYFDFAAANPFSEAGGGAPQLGRDHISATNFYFYFGDLFLGNYVLLYSFVLVPLICCLFFIGFRKLHWDEKKLFGLGTSFIGYLILGAVIAASVLMSIFYFPYQSENKFNVSAVYYSMTQVYAGLPMLVDNLTNTYGLYPHFLNPLFQVTGLSIFKFSFVMAVLLGISFLLNFYCLKQFVSNKVILFLGILTVIFFPFLDFKLIEHFDANFAVYPIRYIVPSLLVFLATLYLIRRSGVIYWTTFVLMAFLVLWNPEFGVVSYISWLLFNTFNDFFDKDGKPAFRKIIFHWLAGAAILAVAFYTFKFSIYLFYGVSPDMAALWNSVFVFSNLGFNMLPMELVHPWNLFALVLILGFVYSMSRWYRKQITAKSSFVFLLSVIGVGFFFYFQGRSHNLQLAQSTGFCLILLTVLGDELWTEIKHRNIFSLNVLFAVFLFIISCSFFEIVYSHGKLYELIFQEEDKEKDAEPRQIIDNSIEFILKHSRPHEKIHVLSLRKYAALFFDGSKRRSAFNPGMIDLFFKRDLERMERILLDSSFNVFITPAAFQDLQFMSRPIAAVAATYEFTTNARFMALAEKRKKNIPSKVFFGGGDELLVHRKYNDDIASARMRIEDASGIKPVDLNGEFSIELLFDVKPQAFALATLIGNVKDSCGFALSRVSNDVRKPNWLFVINEKGYLFNTPALGWMYCVVNVYPDHVDVYANGALVWTRKLWRQVSNSTDKLCIGNLGYMHYYTGAIAEMALRNKAIDKNEIDQTFNEINAVLIRK